MTLFRASRLRGKCEALLVVDLSASVSSGTTWEVDEHGMYCSNDVPLPPSHLHSAYTFKAGQVLKAWTNDTVPSPPHPSLAPTPHWSRPYSHTPTDDVLDSQADHRLRTHTQAPIPPHIPPEEQAPMEDVGQNDPLQLSDSTRAALDQLLSQIDQATSTVETNLTADSYAALAALPLSYPWSCLVLDHSPEMIFGGISSSQSSARTPMRKAATLDKTWKMSNRNGRIRSIILSNTRRMALALLALIWIELFFLARCCLGQVPGGAPFSQRSEQATACTNRMQIRN